MQTGGMWGGEVWLRVFHFAHRAAVEEQYAGGLQKLSKSVLGSQEEG